LIFGFLHPLAFLPGVSRLGLSLTIARFLGFSREDSARLSFLVGLPILLSAGSLSLIKGRDFCTDTLVSLAVLSLIGWLSLLGFMKYTHSPKDSEFVDPVLGLSGTPSMARRLCSEPPARHSFGDWGYSRTGNFFIFAWYRIFLGFVLVALEFIGKYFSH
jgi:undecaprenyl pyrophosphate phosphatase UppP